MAIAGKPTISKNKFEDDRASKIAILASIDGGIGRWKNVKIAAVTHRPEVVFGATYVWLDAHARFVVAMPKICAKYAKNEGKKGAAENAESRELIVVSFEFANHEKMEVVCELSTNELAGRKCIMPITSKRVPIVIPSSNSLGSMTGISFAMPAHVPFDYVCHKMLNSAERALPHAVITRENTLPWQSQNVSHFPDPEIPAMMIVNALKITSPDSPRIGEATEMMERDEYYEGVLNDLCGEFSGHRISLARPALRKMLVEEGTAFVPSVRSTAIAKPAKKPQARSR